MKLLTLKQVANITNLSYSYLYLNKIHFGFFQPLNKGKWLVTQKVLEEKIKELNNASRLASIKEVKKCQLKSVAMSGMLTSKHQMDAELGALLKRKTKRKHLNITID